MPLDPYQDSLKKTLERIQTFLPLDLVERFQEWASLDSSSFHVIGPGIGEPVIGVDGSSFLVLDGGSYSIAAIRAGQSTLYKGKINRRLTPPLLYPIGPEMENPDFPILYRECFRTDPITPLSHEDPHGPATVLRDTLEYWIALQSAQESSAGSLLLLDGALRVSHASHNPVLQEIITTAGHRDLLFAAVAKRTKATWGGGIPLIPAVEGAALDIGLQTPWWVQIETEILDHMQFMQWEHGDLYVARLHPQAATTLKLELPRGLKESTVHETMQKLAGCSDDGRVLGYPYPLLDAHRSVVIDQTTINRIQHDLLREMSGRRYTLSHYNQLFGDLHDEFRKY